LRDGASGGPNPRFSKRLEVDTFEAQVIKLCVVHEDVLLGEVCMPMSELMANPGRPLMPFLTLCVCSEEELNWMEISVCALGKTKDIPLAFHADAKRNKELQDQQAILSVLPFVVAEGENLQALNKLGKKREQLFFKLACRFLPAAKGGFVAAAYSKAEFEKEFILIDQTPRLM
jgi:hypothetical protein